MWRPAQSAPCSSSLASRCGSPGHWPSSRPPFGSRHSISTRRWTSRGHPGPGPGRIGPNPGRRSGRARGLEALARFRRRHPADSDRQCGPGLVARRLGPGHLPDHLSICPGPWVDPRGRSREPRDSSGAASRRIKVPPASGYVAGLPYRRSRRCLFVVLAVLSTLRSPDVRSSLDVLLHGILEPMAMGVVLLALRPSRSKLALLAVALGASVAIGGALNIVQSVPVRRSPPCRPIGSSSPASPTSTWACSVRWWRWPRLSSPRCSWPGATCV